MARIVFEKGEEELKKKFHIKAKLSGMNLGMYVGYALDEYTKDIDLSKFGKINKAKKK